MGCLFIDIILFFFLGGVHPERKAYMRKYQLIWIWQDGDQDSSLFNTREEAEEIAAGFKKAFGNQLQFICINEVTA